MDNLEIAKALFGSKNSVTGQGQTTTTYGTAVGKSENGMVQVNLGGDTVSPDDDQIVEIESTFAVKEGDEVIVSLVGADNTGKAPVVTGVVGRGDQQQTEIDENREEIQTVKNYFWTDDYGAHITLEPGSVEGKNVLLDSDSLDIREGASNSESDQTVYASFGREVTIGSRYLSDGSQTFPIGDYSQVIGWNCIAEGDYSRAEGWTTRAVGDYSHAEGHNCTTSSTAPYSHSEGYYCQTAGYYSHAEGYHAQSGGRGSHAEGYETQTVGNYSHAEGCGSEAYYDGSHAEGGYTVAGGSYSHAEGYHTELPRRNYQNDYGAYAHVQGKWNVRTNNTYCDIIGNGEAPEWDGMEYIQHFSNAYNMDWNGNAEFQGEVYVGGCTPNGETPYPVIRYNTTALRPEHYNGTTWVETPIGGGSGSSAIIFSSVTVPTSAWALSQDPIDDKFIFEATINVSQSHGITSSNVPQIVFSINDAASGIFAPIADTGTDAIIIYAKKIPADTITIPSIVVF